MPDLKTAITLVVLIVAVATTLSLGDYLGYKVGRTKLATIVWISALSVIVIFAIYAAISLLLLAG